MDYQGDGLGEVTNSKRPSSTLQTNLPTSNIRQIAAAQVGQKQRKVTPAVADPNAPKGSLMDFVGATKGLYGNDADQVARHLRDERRSWER